MTKRAFWFPNPGKPGNFEEESVLFSSINERFSEEYVEVYAAVTWKDHPDRVKKLSQVGPRIKEIIKSQTQELQTLSNP